MENQFSSQTHCPYDRDFCLEKERRLKDWASAIEYHARNHINNLIATNKDMFHGCPTKKEDCIRYKRYLLIIESLQKNHER